jgi:hypothetical protein
MSDIEAKLLEILNQFGGEASMFLITNPDSPWAALGDAGALEAAVKSLAAQGALTYDEGDGSVKAT